MSDFIIRLAPPKPFTNRKTHCKRGHPLLPETVYLKPVTVKNKRYIVRECKLCHAAREANYRMSRKIKRDPVDK